jgi:hypothetical protein
VNLGAAPSGGYGIAFGLILLSGICLAALARLYDTAWVRMAWGAMMPMAIAGGPPIRSGRRAIMQAGREDRGSDPKALRLYAAHRASLHIRAAPGLAAVYLTVAKADLAGSPRVTGGAVLLA